MNSSPSRFAPVGMKVPLGTWFGFQGSSSVGGGCWRIWARARRSQMATAMPPSAAEVASKRPVLQRLRGSGVGCELSTSTGPVVKFANFRIGTEFLVACET